MARRSLKPQLNQIRAWVRQGRTDAWIAHQLEISASELREFRSQHDLSADDEDGGAGEVDLRDEIEAEIEAAAAESETDDAEEDVEEEETADPGAQDDSADDEEDAEKPAAKSSGQRRSREGNGRSRDAEGKSTEGEGGQRRRRRRGRRGGRGRRRKAIEATFDHGESEGYGLWLDPAIQDNPVYSQHWAGKREVTVTLDADQIVIRRAGAPERNDGSNDNA